MQRTPKRSLAGASLDAKCSFDLPALRANNSFFLSRRNWKSVCFDSAPAPPFGDELPGAARAVGGLSASACALLLHVPLAECSCLAYDDLALVAVDASLCAGAAAEADGRLLAEAEADDEVALVNSTRLTNERPSDRSEVPAAEQLTGTPEVELAVEALRLRPLDVGSIDDWNRVALLALVLVHTACSGRGDTETSDR